MARVHYFQRYSQRENVDTNNTLLLLSRIQTTDPRLLRDVLSELLSDGALDPEALEVGAQFSQQTRTGSAIPDGMIYQSSFRIVIETKRHAQFDTEQLKRHLAAFEHEDTKVLLLLAPVRWSEPVPGAREQGAHVVSRSFADLVAACSAAGLRDNIELRDIVEDYESLCHESGLISDAADRMMVVTVGDTLRENVDLGLYYAPSARGYQEHHYLGLYTGKAVRAIGEVDNVVVADLDGDELENHENTSEVTDDHRARIKRAMASAKKHGWNIERNHRFFLVREFVSTFFEKKSHGGLRGKKYFSVRDEIEQESGASWPDVKEIAERLKSRTWE